MFWQKEIQLNKMNRLRVPLWGGTVNQSLYADYEGKRVYFCCEGCVPEFQKNPAKYISKLEKEGVKLQAAPKDELKSKSYPATDSDCRENNSCGGCGGCGCSG